MSQEARVNEALRVLGDELRMGMVAAEEYRARRRMLLESWGERDVTTSPTSVARKATQTGSRTMPHARPDGSDATDAGGRRARSGWMAAGLLAAAALGGAVFVVGTPQPEPGVAVRSQRSAEVRAVNEAAAEFLRRNRWEAADVDAFGQRWSALPADQLAAAREEPSVKSLRHELEQNIQAERQALAAANDGARLERLARLMQLVRLLDGEAS